MAQFRIVKLAILASLAFGAVSTVFGAPLTTDVQQGLPATIPDLTGYDRETRQSIELACIVKKSDGPVAYGTCLNRQIVSLQGSPAIPSMSGHDGETRQTALPTSTSGETNLDTSRSRGPAVHSVDAMSRFTSESILKVHQGMSSNKILEMFGAPKNVSQSVCGASVGKPWACTTWEYGEVPCDWASFTFAGGSYFSSD
jgi:hypothetical protein